MWVMTKSDWPVLVNLNRAAQVSYQQVAKFDPKTRVVASTWEQEIVLAECADGDQARALVERIGLALAKASRFLDLRSIEVSHSAE